MTAGTTIKGRALTGALAWTSRHLGAEGRDSLVTAVAGSWTDVFAKRIQASESYPYGAYRDLLVALEGQISDHESGASLHEVGRWTGSRDVSSILRIVAVFASPEAVVARGFSAWGKIYWSRFCSTGTVRLADSGPGLTAIALDDFPDIAPQHCQLMEGWWEAMAISTGAKTPHVHQSLCVHRGDPCCEFRGVWEV